jgi:microcystin-dependent protein
MDLTTIAHLVAGEGGKLRLRQAEVTAVAGDGTLTVLIGGSGVPVSGVKAFASVAPVVGESVWMVTDGVDLIAIGAIGASSGGSSGLPSGAIIMWSGSVATIPSGYALCDGSSGTPDLRGRFIVGAGGSYAVDAVGGEASHTLTAGEVPNHGHTASTGGASADHTHSTPDHRHGASVDLVRAQAAGATGYTRYGTGASRHVPAGDYVTDYSGGGTTGGRSADHSHAVTVNSTTGGGGAHENRPPYYALAYIMKL